MDESNKDSFSQYGTMEKLEELIQKYGERKAKRIISKLGDWYKKLF